MSGIIFGIEAGFQNNVVTGMFTLGPKPAASDPKQRIEPINAPRNLRQDLYWPIQAFNVR
jgi:hypothetical protein